jgi:hypothetical protein
MPRPSTGETSMTAPNARHAIAPRARLVRRLFAHAAPPIGARGSNGGRKAHLHENVR